MYWSQNKQYSLYAKHIFLLIFFWLCTKNMSWPCVDEIHPCPRMFFSALYCCSNSPVLNCLAPLGCKAGQVSFAFCDLALILRRHVLRNDWQVYLPVAPPPPLEFSDTETCARKAQCEITARLRAADSHRLSFNWYSHINQNVQFTLFGLMYPTIQCSQLDLPLPMGWLNWK